MWQDVSLAVDHEHAFEFVSTILDAPGARVTLSQVPKPSDPQCRPQAQQILSRRRVKWKGAKVSFFVFQDLNHGPQILSKRTSFGR